MADQAQQTQAQQRLAAHSDNRELAEQVYNTLMADIEPDLMLETIPLLDQKYAGESKADHDVRMKRYEAAYRKFDEEFTKLMAEVNEEVRQEKKTALHSKEEAARSEESTQLQSLEASFA